jgi:hypothetical protein
VNVEFTFVIGVFSRKYGFLAPNFKYFFYISRRKRLIRILYLILVRPKGDELTFVGML